MPLTIWLYWFTLLVASTTDGSPSLNKSALDPLIRCWKHQVQPLGEQILQAHYRHQRVELEHSARPWQQTPYQATGLLWMNAQGFSQNDTLFSPTRQKTYFAKTQADRQGVLLLAHGETTVRRASQPAQFEQPLTLAPYSPLLLIRHAYQRRLQADPALSTASTACYTMRINQKVVCLFIGRSSGLLDYVTLLEADPMLGDLLTTITYHHYTTLGHSQQPTQITLDKVNGKLHETIQLTDLKLIQQAPTLLDQTAVDPIQPPPPPLVSIRAEKYRDHIYLLTLPHTDDRVLLVEFADFALVAEAPLSSKNGELILKQARQLLPTKPVRYFVFGHHHPHYLGGVRAFIHQGATILCPPGDEDYIKYLVEAPHRLQPDSLALSSQPLKLEKVGQHKVISDGHFQLEIYHIGAQSAHTEDYLFYYFPAQRLLFEDDSVWLPKSSKPVRVSDRQVGLYRSIQQLGLPVEMILQSWPVAEMGIKTEIPFSELAASVDSK